MKTIFFIVHLVCANAFSMVNNDEEILVDPQKTNLGLKKTPNNQSNVSDVENAPLPVLVVDDTPLARTIAKKLLENIGCTVLEAKNGQEALEIMRKTPLMCVIMDIEMPIMRGDDATQTYRKEFPESSLPIIAHSSLQLSKENLGNIGFSSAINKPCKKDELQSMIDQLKQATP